MHKITNIFWLGTKELRGFLHDYVLLAFVIYAFTFAVTMQARSYSQELHNASIAIVDEDHSVLSRRIAHAFLAAAVSVAAADRRAGHRTLDEQRKIHLRGRYPAKLRAGCSGQDTNPCFRSTSTRPR